MALNAVSFNIDDVRYVIQLVHREAEDIELDIHRWKVKYTVADYSTGAIENYSEQFLDTALEEYPVYKILGMYMDLSDETQDLLRPYLIQKGINLDDPYVVFEKILKTDGKKFGN